MKFPFFSRVETKASRALALQVGPSAAVWRTGDPLKLSRESYELNVIAFSAINRIAAAISHIQWEAWRGDKKLKGHKYLDLINRPNTQQSGNAWWRTRVSYLHIWGNSYDEKVHGTGAPRELWTLRPDRMTILPSAAGLPRGYEYTVAGNKVFFSVDETTGASDICHTKLFHPSNDWYGFSPIIAGAMSIDQHNEAMAWTQALLQNSARPSGALIYDGDTALSDDEFNRLKAEIENQYSGAKNAGRPMLLEGGLDWKPMGLSPEDMQTGRTSDAAARNIALTFGVPPLLLNIPGDNTFANYREARLGFYEDTILPLVDYMLDQLNAWLSPQFGDVEIHPDLASIEAIAEKRYKMWEIADNSDDLTLNESRQLKGLPPMPDPLGSTLMVDIRRSKGADPEQTLNDALKGAAYGTVR